MTAPFFSSGSTMATILYKGGELVRVEAERVQAYLANGYSPQNPNAPLPKHSDVILPPGMGLESMTPAEQEKTILEKMGIVKDAPQPIAIVEPRQKRKYTRRQQ